MVAPKSTSGSEPAARSSDGFDLQSMQEEDNDFLEATPAAATVATSSNAKEQEQWSALSIPLLKKELKQRNLKVSGKKTELVDRLLRADRGESLSEDLAKGGGKSVNELKAQLEARNLKTTGSKPVLEARLERARTNTLEDKDLKPEKPSRPNARARSRTRVLGRTDGASRRDINREIARRRADIMEEEDDHELSASILKSMEEDSNAWDDADNLVQEKSISSERGRDKAAWMTKSVRKSKKRQDMMRPDPAVEFDEMNSLTEEQLEKVTDNDIMTLDWYLCVVNRYQEQTMKRAFRRLDDQGYGPFRCVNPVKATVSYSKTGIKRESEERVLPGYMLLACNMTDELQKILMNRQVTGFIKFAGTANAQSTKTVRRQIPTPDTLEPDEIRAFLKMMDPPKESARFEKPFQDGSFVQVIEGPFKGFNGEVLACMPEVGKVSVRVNMFGRSTSMELEISHCQALRGKKPKP